VSEQLAAVVVGCGAVGSGYDERRDGLPPLSHAGAYAAHAATELVAGVDINEAARSRFEQLWGVPSYADLDRALAEHRPALVSICTPPERHSEDARAAIAASVRGLWVEKPLANSRPFAAEIVEAAKSARVALQVNFLRRFDPLHRRAAALVDSALVHADFRFSDSLSNFGSHAIDLCRWFAGDPSWVHAVTSGKDEPVVLLGWESGPTASLSRVRSDGTEIFDAFLFTNHALITLTGLGETLMTWEPEPSEVFSGVTRIGTPVADPELGLLHAMEGGVESLVSHLATGSPLLCDAVDGLAAAAIHDAAEESASAGRLVRLD
jgi:predicted dehydrogenase